MTRPKKQILGLLFIFVVAVTSKLHFSSIGVWDYYVKGNATSPDGLLYGTPRGIRSDEWLVNASWTLSQVNSVPPLSLHNGSIGVGTSALLVGVPTRHWSSLFRPALWGYHFLPIEFAFSWQWMVMSLGLLTGLYILCLLLTKGSQLLATSGALWIYYSSFTQWWFASIAHLLLAFVAACISFRFLWHSRTLHGLCLWAAIFSFWAVCFAINLYPPFQIALFFLGVSLLPLLSCVSVYSGALSVRARVVALMLAGIVACLLVVLYVWNNISAITAMTSTVYPGKRLSLGGDYDLVRYFSGIFSGGFSEKGFPVAYGNVCEASAFVLLWPLSAVLAARNNSRREWMRLVPLLVYILWVTNWIVFGAMESVARISLWSNVPTPRAVLGVGVASILFVVVVASQQRKPSLRPFEWGMIGIIAIILCFMTQQFASVTQGTPDTRQLWISSAAVFGLAIALITGNRGVILLAVVIGVIVPNVRINPLMSGLSPIVNSPLYQAVREVDPARSGVWIVYDTNVAPELVKTVGARVLNGVRYTPDLAFYRLLDPTGQNESVYNRYANVVFLPGPEGSEPVFKGVQVDGWHLIVDPCHSAFTKMNVEYVAFYSRRPGLNYSCLEPVKMGERFLIFRRKLSEQK